MNDKEGKKLVFVILFLYNHYKVYIIYVLLICYFSYCFPAVYVSDCGEYPHEPICSTIKNMMYIFR